MAKLSQIMAFWAVDFNPARVGPKGTGVHFEGTRVLSGPTRVLCEPTPVHSEGTPVRSWSPCVAFSGTPVRAKRTGVLQKGARLVGRNLSAGYLQAPPIHWI